MQATTDPQSDVGTVIPVTTEANPKAICPVSSSVQATTDPQRSDVGTAIPVTTEANPKPTSPVSSAQPTGKESTIPVIIVVAVVIILVIIIVGVVILVVIFRRRKQKSEFHKLQNVVKRKECIELLELNQEGTTEKEASLEEYPNQNRICTDQYSEIKFIPNEKEASSEECLNENNTLTDEYGEVKVIPADGEYTLPASPSTLANLSNTMSGENESIPLYQNIDKGHDPPSTPNVPQGTASDDLYTMPDITSSQTVEIDNETVYSEPIQPSLFTGAVRGPSDSEDLLLYAPIYTIPTQLPKSERVLLKVTGINIREIHELGTGLFGKVILAETVGLSAKDLRLSESDDDKSKSTLVAVKTLKSGAPSTTKESFEKEINFMSKLNDKNVIQILGVCYEDTPFIMMEYMEKGDLNHYLQKFKVLSTTDSEAQGQITTSTLVHMTTQIASAMKYLASHNYVHRDLATRNCLVGPNYLVKIADFGMSRSLYESHYYRIHGRFSLPVRWMSFECFYGKFSQKSDVWAFGVTMWEIFTLAKEQPYNDMSDKQVVDDAIKGKNRKLLGRPDMCPPEVHEIMLKCWVHNTKQRATFEELHRLLSSICSD